MKKMFRKIASLHGLSLVLACWLVTLLGWLAYAEYSACTDAMLMTQGQLKTITLDTAAFTLTGLERVDESSRLQTTDGDPQMHLNGLNFPVRTLEMTVTYSGVPREICLYYTTRAGEDFSQDKRVYPEKTGSDTYRFLLPRGEIAALRLDPCSPDKDEGMVLTFSAIRLNGNLAPLWAFMPSWQQAFCFVLYPALCAAALGWLRLIFISLFGRKQKKNTNSISEGGPALPHEEEGEPKDEEAEAETAKSAAAASKSENEPVSAAAAAPAQETAEAKEAEAATETAEAKEAETATETAEAKEAEAATETTETKEAAPAPARKPAPMDSAGKETSAWDAESLAARIFDE